jgi:hypothetical protein
MRWAGDDHTARFRLVWQLAAVGEHPIHHRQWMGHRAVGHPSADSCVGCSSTPFQTSQSGDVPSSCVFHPC